MLSFRCASCKKKITTEDSLAGQQGECPFCGKVVVAPGTPPTTVPVSSQAGEGLKDYPRCPKCGARRRESDRRCGFCGEMMPETASVRPKTTRKVVAPAVEEGPDRRKLILAGLGAALVLVGAGVWFFSGGDPAPSFPPDEQCRRQMLGSSYAFLEYTQSGAPIPKTLGSEFWLTIVRKQNKPELLKCPGSKAGSPSDYRGPAKDYQELQGGDAVMVCKPGNHPGGVNALTKAGNIEWAVEGSDHYRKILEGTKD